MRRAALAALAVLALPACGSKPAAHDLSFLRGEVVVAETRDGVTRPLRLDPAHRTWTRLGGGDTALYPTGQRVRGGLLCIATWGADEASHGEQLAIVRDAAVERFGPIAGMVRNPTATPDGATVIAETSERSYRDLYAIAADGKITRLTDNAEGNFEPALTADGATLAFASSRDGNAELYSMPAAGGAATRLTDMARDDWGAAWAPDGKTLGFLSDRDGTQRAYLLAGGAPRRLTTETAREAVEAHLRWSPDGKTLAYQRGQGAALSTVLVDVATGKARSLTPAGQVDLDYAWSPDGRHLAVVRHAEHASPGVATVAFVRISDGAIVGSVATEAFAVAWLP